METFKRVTGAFYYGHLVLLDLLLHRLNGVEVDFMVHSISRPRQELRKSLNVLLTWPTWTFRKFEYLPSCRVLEGRWGDRGPERRCCG